jgi:hypothetical protein
LEIPLVDGRNSFSHDRGISTRISSSTVGQMSVFPNLKMGFKLLFEILTKNYRGRKVLELQGLKK